VAAASSAAYFTAVAVAATPLNAEWHLELPEQDSTECPNGADPASFVQ
jgi:hypothetical protein